MTKTFVRMWFRAPDKIKALLVPDEFQPRVCPQCHKISKWQYHYHHGEDGLVGESHEGIHIPRLDQLVRMVPWGWKLEFFEDAAEDEKYTFIIYPPARAKQASANSSEEAMLKGILHEHEASKEVLE